MESRRSAFRRLGNLSRKRFTCRSEPDLCIANQCVVTAANHGTNCPVSENTIPARSGNRAQAACVCTQFSSIRKIHNEYTWRSRLQARSAPMTADKRGSRSITGCIQNIFLIQLQKLATAFIGSQCIQHAPIHCSCKSIGT